MNTIKIAVEGKTTIPLDKLEPFQGELKRIERTEYEQLRKNLIENDFSFTIHIWQHEGHNYIIDGHQRLFTLKQMREIEQFVIPDLPVSVVHADSFQQAKRKVLAGTSQYGRMTQKSLYDYLKLNDIPFDEVVATYAFPEIKMDKFSELFKIEADQDLPEVKNELGDVSDMRSASAGVKQINLFFSIEDYTEFMQKIEVLNKKFGKENVSDTVMELVREAYTAR